MDEASENAPIGIIETTATGEVVTINDRARRLLDITGQDIENTAVTALLPETATGALTSLVTTRPEDQQSIQEYYPTIDRWLRVDWQPTASGAIIYLRSRDQQQQLRDQTERLRQQTKRQGMINTLIATILKRVVDASDYTTIAQTICERLGETDRYAFVWVGERLPGTDRLQVVAANGAGVGLEAQIRDHVDEPSTLPAHVALQTEEPHRHDTLATAELLPKAVRRAIFRSGLQSCLAIPIYHDEVVHGVLSVYTAHEEGITDQEQQGLETLGAVAGFATVAGRQEELLFAETVTELTIEVESTGPFAEATTVTDSHLAVSGVVPLEDGAVACYCTPETTTGQLVETLQNHSKTASVRKVDTDADAIVEAEVTGDTPLTVLTAWGATVRQATYTPETAQLVVRTPPTERPRQIIDRLTERFGDVLLVAKQRRHRNPRTESAVQSDVLDRLTDKQQTALKTAYLAEYFSSPRGSTAEEIADTLGIAGSTLLYHLRKGQRKLLAAVFNPDRTERAQNEDGL